MHDVPCRAERVGEGENAGGQALGMMEKKHLSHEVRLAALEARR